MVQTISRRDRVATVRVAGRRKRKLDGACGRSTALAGRFLRNGQHIRDELPGTAVELSHPPLPPANATVGRRVDRYARDEHRKLEVAYARRLVDQILSRQVVTAAAKDLGYHLRGRVRVGCAVLA